MDTRAGGKWPFFTEVVMKGKKKKRKSTEKGKKIKWGSGGLNKNTPNPSFKTQKNIRKLDTEKEKSTNENRVVKKIKGVNREEKRREEIPKSQNPEKYQKARYPKRKRKKKARKQGREENQRGIQRREDKPKFQNPEEMQEREIPRKRKAGKQGLREEVQRRV